MMDPALSFEPHRRRLLGLAYRMLGSLAEAEDAVQDAYLRWHAVDRDEVKDSRAFLTTATTRICLDVLRSARARREEYVGPWLPEPVVDTSALAPDAQTELAEDLSIALLLALERRFSCTMCSTARSVKWRAPWVAAKLRAVNWRRALGRTYARLGPATNRWRAIAPARRPRDTRSSYRRSWLQRVPAISTP